MNVRGRGDDVRLYDRIDDIGHIQYCDCVLIIERDPVPEGPRSRLCVLGDFCSYRNITILDFGELSCRTSSSPEYTCSYQNVGTYIEIDSRGERSRGGGSVQCESRSRLLITEPSDHAFIHALFGGQGIARSPCNDPTTATSARW